MGQAGLPGQERSPLAQGGAPDLQLDPEPSGLSLQMTALEVAFALAPGTHAAT